MSDEKPLPRTKNGQADGDEADELDGLLPLQRRFIDLSATGTSMEDSARELGVCARTLRRWKRRPDVALAIRNRTTESMALARATLAAGANRAAGRWTNSRPTRRRTMPGSLPAKPSSRTLRSSAMWLSSWSKSESSGPLSPPCQRPIHRRY